MERLAEVVRIAEAAGREILRVYAGGFSVTEKADASPLTEADLAAHRCITTALAGLSPALPVLSEEAADIPWATRRTWARYWLVDPLDGTKEFVKRNGEFTVNIALIENGVPVLGVVHAPAQSRTWAAAQGLGCFAWSDTPQRLHTRKVPETAVLLGSRSHRDAIPPEHRLPLPPHELVERGSSLKFCAIASGEADLHARGPGPNEWDTAAGQCLVEQAGGAVLDVTTGAALRYNQRESLTNPPIAAFGDLTFGWPERLRIPSFR